MNIYIGNLALETTEDELNQLFSIYGNVNSVIIMHDVFGKKPETGFYGYIDMKLKSEGVTAIRSLKGTIINGRIINIIEALPLSHKKQKYSRGDSKTIL